MADKKTKGGPPLFDPTIDLPPPAAAPDAPAPDELPHEEWATRKGMLPRMTQTSMGDRLNPAYWKYGTAKVSREWNDGQHVTEQAFDAAIAAVDEPRFG